MPKISSTEYGAIAAYNRVFPNNATALSSQLFVFFGGGGREGTSLFAVYSGFYFVICFYFDVLLTHLS